MKKSIEGVEAADLKDNENNIHLESAAAVEKAELVHAVQFKEETVQKRSETAQASEKLKDNENLETKTETYVFKSEETIFLDFP